MEAQAHDLHKLALAHVWPATQVYMDDRIWKSNRVDGFGVAPVGVNGELCIGLYAVVYLQPSLPDGTPPKWVRTNAAIETLWPWDALNYFEEMS
jgi:hypothetical protein